MIEAGHQDLKYIKKIINAESEVFHIHLTLANENNLVFAISDSFLPCLQLTSAETLSLGSLELKGDKTLSPGSPEPRRTLRATKHPSCSDH